MTTAVAEHERRRAKTERLRADGIDPFPHFEPRSRDLIASVLARERLHGDGYQLAGRVIARRKRGSVTFLELRDRSGIIGVRITGELSQRQLCPWDIGDIVTVTGHARRLDTGRVGLEASSGRLLAKALHGNHELSRRGQHTRRPELALMRSAELRRRFITRARIIAAIREWMSRAEFIEIETPMLLAQAGGALARPFSTHHHALDRDASLRASSQLSLRRCAIGDLERVFELGRCFRNEGMSARHSPEFTLLEWSMSYSGYRDSAALVEGLVSHLAKTVMGSYEVRHGGASVDLEPPWQRISLRDALRQHTGTDIYEALADPASRPSDATRADSWSDAVHRVYAAEVEPRLSAPTIVYDFPLETHPCAKRHPTDRRLAECFDIVIGGLEIASGGSEISDPDEQWRRLAAQTDGVDGLRQPRPGDRDYVAALGYGAPPSSGAGIGVDRLLMVLLGVESIGEVTLFPGLG